MIYFGTKQEQIFLEHNKNDTSWKLEQCFLERNKNNTFWKFESNKNK